jgi:integrase
LLETLRDRGEHSPVTIETYATHIALVSLLIGKTLLDKLSAVDIDCAYAHLLRRGGHGGKPLAARTVGNVHHFLHAALEQARKWKLISENPARDARAPSSERSRARALTAEEVQRLLGGAAAEPETYAMVAVMLIGGLRRSELLSLAFDAIDFEAGTLEVRRTVVEVGHRPVVRARAKTNSGRRKLRIPAELVTLLRGGCRKTCCGGGGNTGASRYSRSQDRPALRCCPWR